MWYWPDKQRKSYLHISSWVQDIVKDGQISHTDTLMSSFFIYMMAHKQYLKAERKCLLCVVCVCSTSWLMLLAVDSRATLWVPTSITVIQKILAYYTISIGKMLGWLQNKNMCYISNPGCTMQYDACVISSNIYFQVQLSCCDLTCDFRPVVSTYTAVQWAL